MECQQMDKPPIGLMPEKIFLNIRVSDILDAIKRYEKDGKIVPMEWKDELIFIIGRLRDID